MKRRVDKPPSRTHPREVHLFVIATTTTTTTRSGGAMVVRTR